MGISDEVTWHHSATTTWKKAKQIDVNNKLAFGMLPNLMGGITYEIYRPAPTQEKICVENSGSETGL